MAAPASSLTTERLEELQSLFKDWLRQAGRTQADLRRALRAGSIRMPVLIDELHRTFSSQGPAGLAERLCGIEAQWLTESTAGGSDRAGPAAALEDSMGQLDLLLQEIRGEGGG